MEILVPGRMPEMDKMLDPEQIPGLGKPPILKQGTALDKMLAVKAATLVLPPTLVAIPTRTLLRMAVMMTPMPKKKPAS